MRHFINQDGKIYAFEEDGSQDHLIVGDMQPISYEEVLDRTKKPAPTLEQWRATASVTARQGEQQLILADLYEQVDAAIDAITDTKQRKLTRAWYNRAATWDRNSAEFIKLGEALGLTPEQMDGHFKAASEL